MICLSSDEFRKSLTVRHYGAGPEPTTDRVPTTRSYVACDYLCNRVLEFTERDRLVKDAGDTSGGGWG